MNEIQKINENKPIDEDLLRNYLNQEFVGKMDDLVVEGVLTEFEIEEVDMDVELAKLRFHKIKDISSLDSLLRKYKPEILSFAKRFTFGPKQGQDKIPKEFRARGLCIQYLCNILAIISNDPKKLSDYFSAVNIYNDDDVRSLTEMWQQWYREYLAEKSSDKT